MVQLLTWFHAFWGSVDEGKESEWWVRGELDKIYFSVGNFLRRVDERRDSIS